MPITIVDLLDPQQCPDGFVVAKLAGVVERVFPVRPAETRGTTTYGQQQGFILKNSEGELSCNLKDTEKGGGFAPVQKGDQVEIFSTPHAKTKVASGNKLRSWEKDGKLQRILDIYGMNHLRNHTRPFSEQTPSYGAGAAPAQAPAQVATQQAQAPSPAGQAYGRQQREPTLTETQALDLYERTYRRISALFRAKVTAGSEGGFEAFVIEAPTELLDLVHRATSIIVMGAQDGKVRVEPPSSRRQREPGEDEDMPF